MPASVSRSQSGRSVSSFSSAHSRDSVSRLGHGTVGQSDLLSLSESIDNALFGVLFTIVKERYNTGLRFLLVKLALDFVQLFALVFKPSDGWVYDQNLWLWKWLRYLRFEDWLAPRGYALFLAALYTMIGLMMVAVALSAWVAWCFRNRSFPAVWPIKLLRVYANIFFQTLDVATLTLLQLPFDCRWVGYPKELRNTFVVFPSVVCTEMPHVVHMAVAGFTLVLYLAMAIINLLADFELNPTTRNLYATANSTVEVRAFLIKFIMTVITYGIGWSRVHNILLLLLAWYHTWMYLKWAPHLFAWVNHLRVGLYFCITGVALGGVVLAFHSEGNLKLRTRTTNVTLGLLAPLVLLGGAVSYVRLEWWSKYVLMRYRTAAPGLKARRIYKFLDPKEVEIAARVCRKWTDQHHEMLDRQAAKEAEIIIKGGMQIFPSSAYLIIIYSNLLIDVMESTHTGYSQLQLARKCSPNFTERFAIFVREQEHMQRSAGANSGESSVDLMSYVEYQRNHRLVMRAHRNALVAIRKFWQLLLHNQVAFTTLAKALMRIEKSVRVAEGIYKNTLQRYPASPKLLRGYGKFLEAVKNNPWKASKYFSEADKLREQQEQDEATMAVMDMTDGEPGSHMLNRVDERVSVVFLINSAGVIQMANKNACSLLGYGKGELEAKNINLIMPPPYSQRHNRYLRQYVQTGRERVMSSVNTVLALHKARYVLPVKLAVSKVSGATEDSVFMGVLEPLAVDPNEAHLYLLPNGVVTAMDLPFYEWLGHELGDIIGKDVGALLQEAEAVRAALSAFDTSPSRKSISDSNPPNGQTSSVGRTLQTAPSGIAASGAPPTPPTAAAGQHSDHGSVALAPGKVLTEHVASVFFLHKYSQPVECSVTMQRMGIGTECIVEVTLRRVGPPQMLVLTGASGRIKYVSSELARALGTAPSALLRQAIGDIMPQPWGTLHEAWIRSHSSQAGPGQFMAPPGSCRTGMAMVLGASHRIQGYYRMAITSPEDPDADESGTDSAQHVVQVHPSSREEALADRRLVLTVDADGIVTEVEDGPGWLFGFSPAQLLGRSLADCVATLRPTGTGADGAQEEEEDVSDLLGMLVTKAMQHGGCSWRVGVTPPMDEVELAALGPMRDAVVAKRTVAAVMEIEATLDTDAIRGAAGSGGSGANSKSGMRSMDGGAKGASRAGTFDSLMGRQATEDSNTAGHRQGGRAAQTGRHAFTAPGYLNAEPMQPSVATSGGPAPGGDAPERAAPQRRARRSSWVAVEAPGGGIMVVSGRKASGLEPTPGAAGDRIAPLSPDASAISFSARRPPRAVRMQAARLGADAAGGEVQGASGLQGTAAPGAAETPLRTRSAGPFGLEPEASMVLEPLAPPGYPGAARGEIVSGSLHGSGFAAASGHAQDESATAGMAVPSEQAPFALRGRENTYGRSPFETAQSAYGGGITADEQAAQRSPGDPASGAVGDSAAAAHTTGTSTPGATAGRPLAAAGSRTLSRQLTAELNARLVGSMLSVQASQEGPGAGPLLPGGNTAEHHTSHVRSAMLAQLLMDNPDDLAGAVATALNASSSSFPARAASMRNRGGQGSEAFSRGTSRCLSIRRQQEAVKGGPQEQQLEGGDEEDDLDDLGGDERVVLLRVSLWRADLLTTVVEVDGNNKIASFVGEDLVPPGLVFGALTSSLVSASLPSLLDLPDRSVAGLFHDLGTARRGGLKTTAKQSNKVGALRQVCGRHADGQPLQLSMQAVVRESAPNRTYVVLKPRQPHQGSREALLASLQSQDVGLKLDTEEQAEGSEEQHSSLTGLSVEAEPAGGFDPHQTGSLHGGAHRGAAFKERADWLPELQGSGEVRDRASLRRNSEESSCAHSTGDGPLRPAGVHRSSFRERAATTESHDRGSPRQVRSNGATWPTPESRAPRAVSPMTPELRGGPGRVHEADSMDAGGLAALKMLSEADCLPDEGTVGPSPAEPHPFAVLDGAAASLPLLRRHGSGAYDMSRSAGRVGGSGSGMGSRTLLSPRVRGAVGGSSGLACPPMAALAADHLHERLPPAEPDARIGADRWSGSTLSAEGELAGGSAPGEEVPQARRHVAVRKDSAYAEEEPHMREDASSEDWEVLAAMGRSRSVTFSASTRQRSAEAVGEGKEAFSGSGASDDAGGKQGGRDAAAFAAGMERLSRGQEAAERDDDGDSETSGVSGVSEAMAGVHQADYRRGKRYRKLLKVLTLPSVQRAATNFQWQALLANVAQLLANLVAFVLLTVLLRHEVENINGLVSSKRSIRLVHEIFINLQKLNNIYEGAVPAMGYYNTSDLPQLSADLLSRLDRFTILHTALYTSIKYNLRPDPSEPYDPTNEQDIWNKPIHNETVFYGVSPYRVEYVNTSLWDLVNHFIERTQEVQHTHDEWGPVHGTLSDMDAYRYCMTNGPSSVFAGYKDAMLARTMKAIEAAQAVNRLQLVMLVVQGGAVCVLLLLYMWWLQRRVSQQRYGMYSLFMILPVGLLRALASKSVTVMDDSDDGEESSDEEKDERHPQLHGHKQPDPHNQQGSNGGTSFKTSQSGSNGPKRSLSNLFKSRSRSGRNAKQRHLVPSNHDSISLLTPFVVWGGLICVLYAVGYVLLSKAALPLSLLSVHKSTVVRMHRLMLYSLRVGSEATDEGKAMLQPVLQHELREFEREWHVLLYGANSTARQDPRFQMCSVGTALGEQDLSHRIFRFSGCLPDTRAHVLSGPVEDTCRPTDSAFYAAVTHGTNHMVERLMEDVAYLTRLPPANISINSTHLDYIMSEGEGNIDVGLTDIADSLLADIRRLYTLVGNLQICSLVLSWLLAVAFIFLQLRPFIARNRTETHRIARMLSELPADVDVESMVRRMLLRDGDGSGRRTSSTGMGREGAVGAGSSSFGRLLASAGGVGGAHVLSPGKAGTGGTGADSGARQMGSPRKGLRGS